jgi:hypothetical protein
LKLGKSVQDAIGIFGTRVIYSAMGVVSGIILARWLGPYDRGLLALALLIPSTVVTVVKLGVSQATVYYINRKEASVDQVASNSVYLALGLGALSVVVVLLLRDDLDVLRAIPTWALIFALVRVPLLLLDNYLYGVLQATGEFGIYNSRLLISEALRLVLVAIFVMGFNLGLMAAVIIYSAIAVINMAWLMFTMSRKVRLSAGFDRGLMANMLSFGVRSYMQVVTAHLLLRISIYMVQSYLGPEQTAFYALALHMTETVLEVPQAVGVVLYPRLASLPEDEVHRLTAQTCRRTLMVTGPAAVAIALFGPWLITAWYGQAFAPAGAAAVGGGRGGDDVDLRHHHARLHGALEAARQHRRGRVGADRQRPAELLRDPALRHRRRGVLDGGVVHCRVRAADRVLPVGVAALAARGADPHRRGPAVLLRRRAARVRARPRAGGAVVGLRGVSPQRLTRTDHWRAPLRRRRGCVRM